jgi:hypothetical protein
MRQATQCAKHGVREAAIRAEHEVHQHKERLAV